MFFLPPGNENHHQTNSAASASLSSSGTSERRSKTTTISASGCPVEGGCASGSTVSSRTQNAESARSSHASNENTSSRHTGSAGNQSRHSASRSTNTQAACCCSGNGLQRSEVETSSTGCQTDGSSTFSSTDSASQSVSLNCSSRSGCSEFPGVTLKPKSSFSHPSTNSLVVGTPSDVECQNADSSDCTISYVSTSDSDSEQNSGHISSISKNQQFQERTMSPLDEDSGVSLDMTLSSDPLQDSLPVQKDHRIHLVPSGLKRRIQNQVLVEESESRAASCHSRKLTQTPIAAIKTARNSLTSSAKGGSTTKQAGRQKDTAPTSDFDKSVAVASKKLGEQTLTAAPSVKTSKPKVTGNHLRESISADAARRVSTKLLESSAENEGPLSSRSEGALQAVDLWDPDSETNAESLPSRHDSINGVTINPRKPVDFSELNKFRSGSSKSEKKKQNPKDTETRTESESDRVTAKITAEQLPCKSRSRIPVREQPVTRVLSDNQETPTTEVVRKLNYDSKNSLTNPPPTRKKKPETEKDFSLAELHAKITSDKSPTSRKDSPEGHKVKTRMITPAKTRDQRTALPLLSRCPKPEETSVRLPPHRELNVTFDFSSDNDENNSAGRRVNFDSLVRVKSGEKSTLEVLKCSVGSNRNIGDRLKPQSHPGTYEPKDPTRNTTHRVPKSRFQIPEHNRNVLGAGIQEMGRSPKWLVNSSGS